MNTWQDGIGSDGIVQGRVAVVQCVAQYREGILYLAGCCGRQRGRGSREDGVLRCAAGREAQVEAAGRPAWPCRERFCRRRRDRLTRGRPRVGRLKRCVSGGGRLQFSRLSNCEASNRSFFAFHFLRGKDFLEEEKKTEKHPSNGEWREQLEPVKQE